MIGIRTGGVFSNNADMEDIRARINKVIKGMRGGDFSPNIGDDVESCMSKELVGQKGSYVVIAGVFNYWRFDKSFEFARKLSEEFGVEVMVMSWEEEIGRVECQIFLGGKPLLGVKENPIAAILRRVI